MNDKEKKHMAEDLDALLDGKPSNLAAGEAKFAHELMKLSHQLQPEEEFSRQLNRRLGAAHLNQESISPRHTFFSRRVLLPLAGAALVLGLILFGLPLSKNPIQISAPQLSPSSPINQTTSLTTADASPVLPALPLLGITSAQAATNINEMFPKANWILQAALPESPADAEVYIDTNPEGLTSDDGKVVAERLGLKGQAYIVQPNPQFSPMQYHVMDGFTRAEINGAEQFSLIPDFRRTRSDYGQPLPFQDMTAKAAVFLKEKGLLDFDYTTQPGMLFTDEVNFIRMLDGYPLLNANPIQTYLTVSLTADGNIRRVNYQGLRLETVGRYPLRSAGEAWQGVLNGKLFGRFSYQLIPPFSALQDYHWSETWVEGQRADLYGWAMVYQPAQPGEPLLVTIDEMPIQGELKGLDKSQEFLHAWGTIQSSPLGLALNLEDWETTSLPEDYSGFLEQEDNAVILATLDGHHLTFVNPPSGLPLNSEPAVVSGWLSPDGNQIKWLTIDAGPKICQSISFGFAYSANGGGGGGGGGSNYGMPPELCTRYGNTSIQVTAGGYDNLQGTLNQALPQEILPTIEPLPTPLDGTLSGPNPPFEPIAPPDLSNLITGQAKVEKINLVYLNINIGMSGLSVEAGNPARYIQPLWSFSGHLEDGREFNIFVQAVRDEYLK